MKVTETHYIDGKKSYSRVSTILNTAYPMTENPYAQKNIKGAGERGTNIHAILSSALITKKSGGSLSPILAGLKGNTESWARKAESGIKWIEANLKKADIIAVEVTIVSDKWGFAGTVDAIVKIQGKIYLIDWKSSAFILPRHRLQLGGYQILFAKKASAMIIHLKENVAVEIELKKDSIRKAAFLSLLQFHNLKNVI